MEIPSGLRKFLDKIGVNTTRLQWRMYQWEKRREANKDGSRLPESLRWMKYPHKFCLKCNALNDRTAKTCHKCGARLPSMLGYRLFRTLGVLMPVGGASVVFVFEAIIVMVFVLMIVMQGPKAFLSPTMATTMIFGAYYPVYTFTLDGAWRAFGFALVHGGILHIFFNMFCLMQIGPILESQVGSKRMLVVITATQLTSAIGTYVWYIQIQHMPYASTIGASGFLMGLIGFGVTYFHSHAGSGNPYTKILVQWAIYTFIFGLFVGANNAAHAGGFLGGMAIGMIPLENYRNRAVNTFWNTGFAASIVVWLVTIGFLVFTVATNWLPGGQVPH